MVDYLIVQNLKSPERSLVQHIIYMSFSNLLMDARSLRGTCPQGKQSGGRKMSFQILLRPH